MPEPAYWQTVAVDDTWNPATVGDWEEPVELTQVGPGYSFSRDDGTAGLVGHVPYNKAYDARRKILGYAWADSSTPWELHRVNPLSHPDDKLMRAITVDYVGYNPFVTAQPTPPPPAPPPPPAAYRVATVPDTFPGTTNYARALMTVKFRTMPYPYLTDAEMVIEGGRLQEYFRNCAIFETCDPILETLLADSEPFLKWVDTPSGATTPAANTDIPSTSVPEYISRANFVLAWYGVPGEYIMNPYLPSKIMNCVGKVNEENNWFGVFPKGTLKLEAPRFKKSVQAPIRVTNATYTIPFCYDVFLPLTWIDPTPAPVTSGGGTPTFRGWNLFPWSRTGKYYSVARKSSAPGTPLPYFPFAPFDSMFTHVGAP